MAGVEKAEDDLAVVDLLAGCELEFEPGSRHKISSSNYFLLGFVVQRLTSLSMGEWTEKIVFGPLGMDKPVFADHPEKAIENRAKGYRRQFDGAKAPYVEVENPNVGIVGDTGLYMSMEQLLIWEKALYQKKIGGEVFGRLMERTGSTLHGSQAVDYAFGLTVSHKDTPAAVRQQAGKSVGFSSIYRRYAAGDLTVIVLCNCEDADVRGLADVVAAHIE